MRCHRPTSKYVHFSKTSDSCDPAQKQNFNFLALGPKLSTLRGPLVSQGDSHCTRYAKQLFLPVDVSRKKTRSISKLGSTRVYSAVPTVNTRQWGTCTLYTTKTDSLFKLLTLAAQAKPSHFKRASSGRLTNARYPNQYTIRNSAAPLESCHDAESLHIGKGTRIDHTK